jgi:GGDEF domain-containing protein
MLLVPGMSYDDTNERMGEIFYNLENDEYLKDKTFTYSISYGIIAVDKENKLPASDILSIADERMYENKRERKKNRLA